MSRLIRDLERRSTRGPSADPRAVVRQALATAGRPAPAPASRWRVMAACSLGVLAVIGAAWLGLNNDRSPSDGSVSIGAQSDPFATSPSDPTTGSAPGSIPAPTRPDHGQPAAVIPPGPTLPITNDVVSAVPPTVIANVPPEWYRLQPDLDVAWIQPTDGPSEACFRTPTVSRVCNPDHTSQGSVVAVLEVGQGYWDVVFVAPASDLRPSQAEVHLEGGSTVVAAIQWDDEIGWGVGRVVLAIGDRISSAELVEP